MDDPSRSPSPLRRATDTFSNAAGEHFAPQPLSHYENFPVASWLCPPTLRPAIASLYRFARTADDIADEGSASAAERLVDLRAYDADLRAVASGHPPSDLWPQIFWPLKRSLFEHALPLEPLTDLLTAFAQDVNKTEAGAGYADRDELTDYCRRSANPVGRLLLHLYGVADAAAIAQSDAICTALQLINFWQDLSVDVPRGRLYVPASDAAAHGLTDALTAATARKHLLPGPHADALVTDLAAWARATMLAGAPLVHRLPGRAGWELRFVVQGALRVLDKVDRLRGACLVQRPRVRAWDAPWLLARAASM